MAACLPDMILSSVSSFSFFCWMCEQLLDGLWQSSSSTLPLFIADLLQTRSANKERSQKKRELLFCVLCSVCVFFSVISASSRRRLFRIFISRWWIASDLLLHSRRRSNSSSSIGDFLVVWLSTWGLGLFYIDRFWRLFWQKRFPLLRLLFFSAVARGGGHRCFWVKKKVLVLFSEALLASIWRQTSFPDFGAFFQILSSSLLYAESVHFLVHWPDGEKITRTFQASIWVRFALKGLTRGVERRA